MAPVSILPNADRPSGLLLANPPPPPPEPTFKTTAIKGQLIRRNPLNSRVHQANESSVWKPSTCLWVQLVRRLISSSTPTSGINVAYQHYFGRALEDTLLPHGLQLPQTNVQTCTLNPPAFQQPCGLGLERILALLRAFLPDWKLSSPFNSERVLWGFLELLLQPPPSISSSAKGQGRFAYQSSHDHPCRIPGLLIRLQNTCVIKPSPFYVILVGNSAVLKPTRKHQLVTE